MEMSASPTPQPPSRRYATPSIYDAPTIALSMAMDGELTFRGLKAAFLQQDSLTPSELDTYAERLKDRAGRNPISDSLADIVSNPFVWLWVGTAPWASAALAEAGGPIFSASKRALAYTRQKFPFLGSLLAPTQVFADTVVPALGHEAEAHRHQILLGVEEAAGDTFSRVIQKLGVKTLDFTQLAPGSPERLKAEKFSALWTALQEGLHDNWSEKLVKTSKSGPQVVSIEHSAKVARDAVAQHMADMLGGDLNLTNELMFKTRGVFDRVRTTAIPDEKAAYRVLRTIVNKEVGTTSSMDAFSKGWIKAILDRTQGPFKGMSDAEALAILKAHNVDLPLTNKYYNPHNTSVLYANGERVLRDEQALGQEIRSLSPSISAFPASPKGLRHNPRFWEILADEGLLTEEGQKAAMAVMKKAEGATADKAARFLDHNPYRGMERYVNDMTRVSFLAKDIEQAPAVLYANQRSAGLWKQHGVKPRPVVRDTFGDTGLDLGTAISDHIKGGKVPVGGFTVADALNADLAFIGAGERATGTGDIPSLRYMKEYVIPRLKGEISVEHGAAKFATEMLGSAVGRFVDVFGDSISEAGPGAKRVVESLRRFSDLSSTEGTAKSTGSFLTKLLYSSHLASPSSVVTNLLQPMNALAFLPAKDVSKGVTRAWGQVFNYMEDRFKQGAALGPEARNALIKKHIPFAEEAGILRNIYDMEQEVLKKTPNAVSNFLDWTLKGFEKAEWVNRVAVVEAMASRHGISEAAQITPMIRDDMRQATEQINFASSWWNTPALFQKGVTSDPLLKMFMTFPLRMLTYSTYTLPNLVQGGKSFVPNLARVMGFSTVAYQLAKNLAGADISRGLFYSGTTDILPFMGNGKFDSRESPIPIPPIIDIPATAFRGLLEGDKRLIGDASWRLVPGGTFLRRMWGFLPSTGDLNTDFTRGTMQRTYVDWKKRAPDGSYPLYDHTGNIIEMVTPGQIARRVMLGGMAETSTPAQEAKYLIKQRDQILEYRRNYLDALLNNRIPEAQSVKAEFERRFQMPLTITKQQLESSQKNREVPRTERIVDRMPAAVRAAYTRILTPQIPTQPPGVGVTPEQVPLWSEPNDPTQAQSQPPSPAFGSF